jgi:hypothetical protein
MFVAKRAVRSARRSQLISSETPAGFPGRNGALGKENFSTTQKDEQTRQISCMS